MRRRPPAGSDRTADPDAPRAVRQLIDAAADRAALGESAPSDLRRALFDRAHGRDAQGDRPVEASPADERRRPCPCSSWATILPIRRSDRRRCSSSSRRSSARSAIGARRSSTARSADRASRQIRQLVSPWLAGQAIAAGLKREPYDVVDAASAEGSLVRRPEENRRLPRDAVRLPLERPRASQLSPDARRSRRRAALEAVDAAHLVPGLAGCRRLRPPRGWRIGMMLLNEVDREFVVARGWQTPIAWTSCLTACRRSFSTTIRAWRAARQRSPVLRFVGQREGHPRSRVGVRAAPRRRQAIFASPFLVPVCPESTVLQAFPERSRHVRDRLRARARRRGHGDVSAPRRSHLPIDIRGLRSRAFWKP